MSKKTALISSAIVAVIAFSAGTFFPNNKADDSCNVLALSLNGYLNTYPLNQSEEDTLVDMSFSDDILEGISLAQNDPKIKAVLLAVDSPGGNPVAGEEISNALKKLNKPSVSVIRSLGASSAYWASTGADKIYASNLSDIGSIAITASYLDESKKIEKDGYQYTELSSGKYKDLGDPSRTLTAEEREIIMSDLKKAHDSFVQDIAVNRNLDISAVSKLANGLTYIGADALKFGLIDEIGDISSAVQYLEEQMGEKAEVCWY